MIGTLEDKRAAIADICARYGVVRLYAFGSVVRDDFKPEESDVDLLVELGPMEPYARVDAYFGMLDALRALFDRDVDLVMIGAVRNKYMARAIERTKQLVYAA